MPALTAVEVPVGSSLSAAVKLVTMVHVAEALVNCHNIRLPPGISNSLFQGKGGSAVAHVKAILKGFLQVTTAIV